MEYRPEIDPAKGVHTEVFEVVRKGDEIASGHYLERSTMAEIIRAAGGKAYVAGAKPVALLPDRCRALPWIPASMFMLERPFRKVCSSSSQTNLGLTRCRRYQRAAERLDDRCNGEFAVG